MARVNAETRVPGGAVCATPAASTGASQRMLPRKLPVSPRRSPKAKGRRSAHPSAMRLSAAIRPSVNGSSVKPPAAKCWDSGSSRNAAPATRPAAARIGGESPGAWRARIRQVTRARTTALAMKQAIGNDRSSRSERPKDAARDGAWRSAGSKRSNAASIPTSPGCTRASGQGGAGWRASSIGSAKPVASRPCSESSRAARAYWAAS